MTILQDDSWPANHQPIAGNAANQGDRGSESPATAGKSALPGTGMLVRVDHPGQPAIIRL